MIDNRTVIDFVESARPVCPRNSPRNSQPLSYTGGNNNRVDNYGPTGYDAAGNVLYDLTNHYAYDAEGRLCAVSNPDRGSMQYIYDAEGRRVAQGTISSLSCTRNSNGFSLTENYVLGQSGEHVSELGGTGNFLRSHVYANGQLLATYSSSGTEFSFNDWLGSKRLVANADGKVAGTCINLPFGEELICSGSVPLSGHHFTGQIHDPESLNDYFGARYYSNYSGRFLSPDPSGLAFAHPGNPQGLNLYSYALNNPLINIDPTGMECVWDDGSYDSADDPQTGNAKGCSGQGGTYVNPGLFENALLTNGQNANTQYGSWSGQSNSTLASSWTIPSGTAYGSQWAAGQEVDEALGYFYGNGAKPTLIYNNNDPFTVSFKKSLGMQGIMAGVSANCSATSGSVPVGTSEAFANTMIDGPFLKSADGSTLSGYYTPEAQMGGFFSTFSRSGGVVNITVTNPITLNSLALHATAGVGIPNPASGHLGTVNQQLNITAFDPCQ